MSSILEKMRAAHAAREFVKVPVPEYDDVWYFKPLLLNERMKIRSAAGCDDDMVLSVETMILKACDEKGAPKFADDAASREVLFEMTLTLLQRIMTQAEGGPEAAGAVKND